MTKVITAKGKEYEAQWADISTIDGTLRFSLIGASIGELFTVFSDQEETAEITVKLDEHQTIYEGFTGLKGIELFPGGNIVVRLLPQA